jgi:cytochrome c peroxidase
MSLANTAYNATLTWGNPNTFLFEQQALTPMFGNDPIIELGLADRDQLLDRLRPDPRYQRLFAEAFPEEEDPFTLDAVVKALASFERTLLSFNSPVDRYLLGIDDLALSNSALRGMDLFYTDTRPSGGLLECHHCHGNQVTFSSSYYFEGTSTDRKDATKFLNNALYAVEDGPCSAPNPNTGRVEPGNYPLGNRGTYEFADPSSRDACLQMGAFKATTLRNIAVTGPYMHDGSIATLDEVIDHYVAGGRASNNPFKSGFVEGFQINASERQDLLAFLNALTDEEFLTNPKFADPFQPPLCTGDCNYDGVVSVDELVTNVGIEMEAETLASCLSGDPDGDGTVDLGETIQAVNAALKGCPERDE